MIVVTGGTGFIGRYVIKEILRSGQKIRCFARSRKNLPKSSKIEVCIGDIRDKEAVERAVKGCKIITPLAAVLNPHNKDIYDINVNGTKNLINAAKKYGVERIGFTGGEQVLRKDMYRF